MIIIIVGAWVVLLVLIIKIAEGGPTILVMIIKIAEGANDNENENQDCQPHNAS